MRKNAGKKLISFAISGFMLLNLFPMSVKPTEAGDLSASKIFISDNEIREEMTNHLLPLIEFMRKSEPDSDMASGNLKEFSVLNSLTIDEKGNPNNIENNDVSVLYFPIQNDKGKICGIFTITKTSTGINSCLGEEFAKQLNEATSTNNSRIVLMDNNSDGIRIISTSSEETSNFLQKNVENTEILQSEVDRVDTNPKRIANSYSNFLSGYPFVSQWAEGKQRGLCWAATVASMCRYEKPSIWGNLNAQNVSDYCGVDYDAGGTNSDAINALNHYLGYPYYPIETDALDPDGVKTVIDNDDPAYLQCGVIAGIWPWPNGYHAVALCGYDDNGYYIQVMNPAIDEGNHMAYASMDNVGNWTFTSGGITFTWYKTVRLFYR